MIAFFLTLDVLAGILGPTPDLLMAVLSHLVGLLIGVGLTWFDHQRAARQAPSSQEHGSGFKLFALYAVITVFVGVLPSAAQRIMVWTIAGFFVGLLGPRMSSRWPSRTPKQ